MTIKTAATPIPPAVRFVLATLVMNAIGFGLIVPVVPELLREMSHGSIGDATAMNGWLSTTFAVFQFVFSPIMGNLSDRYGRRPVLLFSVAGFAVDFVVLAFAPTLAWLFAARALSGVFGATNGPAQSVIADITTPEERSRYFGLLGAAFGVGFVLGPAIGGLLGEFGYRVPIIAAAALLAANTLYGIFALPETLKPENRRDFDWRRANLVGSLLQIRQLPNIGPISIVYLLWQVATLVYPLVWPFFCMGRFHWSTGMVGASLAAIGISMVIAQTLVLPRFVARYGERKTALIGACGATLGMLFNGLVPAGWMVIAIMPLVAMQSLVHPNLTAMMSRRATAQNQGEVQGFASAVMAVGSIIAPLAFNPLFAWFAGPNAPFAFWGAAFVLAGAIAAIAAIILWRMAPAGSAMD